MGKNLILQPDLLEWLLIQLSIETNIYEISGFSNLFLADPTGTICAQSYFFVDWFYWDTGAVKS